MKNKRKIVWESQHLEVDYQYGKLNYAEKEQTRESYYDDEYYDGDQENGKLESVMATPFGLWRVDDSMNPYKQFKMWMGHTNFTITNEIMSKIKSIPGVEILLILTRYRFIIGVAKLFNIRQVRTEIENKICNDVSENRTISIDKLVKNNKIKSELKTIYNKVNEFEDWAIYVFPNGHIDYITSDMPDYKEKLKLYKNSVDKSNGILIEPKYDKNNNED